MNRATCTADHRAASAVDRPINTGARLAIVACLLGSFASSCSERSQEQMRAAQRGTLERGEAARVGDEVVTVAQVAALSKATGVSLEEARSKLVFDALMAAGAQARGYDQHDDVVIGRRSVLARALLERMKEEAAAKPITEEEVRAHTASNWLDMDRPVARRTTHAVVMPEDPKDETQAKKADGIAERIAEAVSSATDAKSFKEKAESVDAGGMKVLVQDLPPVVEDGRVADLENRPPPGVPPRTFAEEYVKEAFRLAEVGDKSKAFRSPFGSHVVMLTGIQPALRIPFEKRRQLLTEEIRTARVKKELDALKESLRARTTPSVERNANALLQLISEEPDEKGP